MTTTIDDIMERASQSLAQMDYLTTEALCLDALVEARAAGDWSYYARILLPLQEARRQRRMIACDAGVRLGPSMPTAGVAVLTHPSSREEAKVLRRAAHAERRYVEVMFIDNPADASHWTVRSYDGPDVACEVGSPAGDPDVTWYLQASETLGDAAIAQADAPIGSIERIDQLEQRLAVVIDHEKLHQRLAEAARAIR